MVKKRWKILQADTATVDALHTSLKINPVLCKLLAQRNVNTFEEAKTFFRPQLSDLHDPWLMKDMDKAVDRITKAMQNREKILVFGDYDVDGTTSVACMYQFFQRVYETDKTDFYIPHRYKEGYGVSRLGIEYAHENGFTLIVSLDCGIKSVELIAYAKTLGIDFIVCDHHLPDTILPPAYAILNPKQPDCNYPYKELCGCGVGFKLITALTKSNGLPEDEYLRYLDLVATAIAADIVPITGENRVLAFYGLKRANENPNEGIKAIKELSGSVKDMQINSLVFMIAPRINAAGRMDDACKAVQLFVSKNRNEAMSYAEMLHSDNTDRKEADKSITEEALALIRGDEVMVGRKSTVVFQQHWHKGVVGIVASRLIEHFYRPTIVLTQSGDVVAGSARSVNGFNLYEAVHACREHLIGYGGHFAAAGMTMLPEKVADFSSKFEEVVATTILPESLVPEITIDAEISFADIKPTFYNIICQMEPFGPDNMRPVFVAKNVYNTPYSKIVKESHIKFVLKQNNVTITGIGFGMADKFPLLQMNRPLNVVFTLDENEWNNTKTIQMKVVDFSLANEAGES